MLIKIQDVDKVLLMWSVATRRTSVWSFGPVHNYCEGTFMSPAVGEVNFNLLDFLVWK